MTLSGSTSQKLDPADADGKLRYSAETFDRLTHYLLRYPAKFHPPIAKHLLQIFTQPNDVVLDPFCGSGTLLVEASLLGRHSVGMDIDPVAVLAASVKARRVRPAMLERSAAMLLDRLHPYRPSASTYKRRMFRDFSDDGFLKRVRTGNLNLPKLPNQYHWFRRYVLLELALIKRELTSLENIPASHKQILLLCFAATIRRASNADPVPVSGLEVTHHMRKLDEAGRVIDPYSLFETEVERACRAFRDYWDASPSGYDGTAFQKDACAKYEDGEKYDAIITSPPYHGAVDYYRRHTLETYWLDFADTAEDRLALLPRYIGRAKVSMKHEYAKATAIAAPYTNGWEKKIRLKDSARADAFKHYALSMQTALARMATVLSRGSPAVLVVGNSRWNGEEIETATMLAELAGQLFREVHRYWYPIKNRYMSYARHNGASIDREYVLVLERK